MFVLGIESSCDETAVAIVENGRKLCSSVIATSADIHAKYGGVVPEIASRVHVEYIVPVLSEALSQAGCTWSDIGAVAVTQGPGLTGSLLVGISAAKALSLSLQKPLLGIHHIAAHIAANYLASPELEPPFLSLVVSGGHSQVVHVRDYMDYQILGRTRDDAAGEAFDKVSRAVGLGYPGGPLMDKLAKEGNPQAIRFPQTRFADGSLDYSFSGVKTAALTFIQQTKQQAARQNLNWDKEFPLADFVASYQEAILQALLRNVETAMQETGLQILTLAGGVSANSRLRQLCAEKAAANHWQFYCPPLSYCTDNAAMVASLGYYKYLQNPAGDGLDLNAIPHWPMVEE